MIGQFISLMSSTESPGWMFQLKMKDGMKETGEIVFFEQNFSLRGAVLMLTWKNMDCCLLLCLPSLGYVTQEEIMSSCNIMSLRIK